MPSLRISRAGARMTLPVLGAAVVGAVAYAPLYCFPLLVPEFERSFDTSREFGQMPWTAFLLVSAASSPLVGRAYDMFADRYLLLIGTLLSALGWVLVSVAPNAAILIALYGTLLAVGLQLVFVGTTTAVARRYAGVAGLALGVSYAGPGIGVAVALPLAAVAIPAWGWQTTTLVFGALALVALPFVLLMTSGPAVVFPVASAGAGLHETSAPGAIAASQERMPAGGRARRDALRRILRTRRFLILLLGAVAIGCIDEGVFQTSARHAVNQGIDAGFAANMLALQCYAYVAGQVVGGGLSDRFGRRYIGLMCAGLIVVGATATFAATGSTLALAVAGNSIYGFGIGATIAIRSAAFSDVFGGHNFGAIFGIIAIAYPAGGILVMNAGGIFYDRIGNYWPVYFIVIFATLAWSIALLVAGPRHHGLRRRWRGVRARLPV
ncbi:MAG TPA: MFS transporter [Candidatus Limnocylindrales bacterium]